MLTIFRPLSCLRADERVVVPRPAVLVEEHPDAAILELEARLAKRAVLGDAVARARESSDAPSIVPVGDVVRDLGEVAAAPHANRTANDSGFASCPHFTRHRRSRASRTATHGCEPARCSSTNVNGGTGTPSAPPGPKRRSARSAARRLAPDAMADAPTAAAVRRAGSATGRARARPGGRPATPRQRSRRSRSAMRPADARADSHATTVLMQDVLVQRSCVTLSRGRVPSARHLMAAKPLDLTLELAPKARFDVVDLRSHFAAEHEALGGVSRTASTGRPTRPPASSIAAWPRG